MEFFFVIENWQTKYNVLQLNYSGEYVKGEQRMAIVQLRVDDELKNQAIVIYEKLGIDLSTAIRMFLKRSVDVNGIPFPMTLDIERPAATEALKIMRAVQDRSEKNGLSNMSLEEINEEIKLARQERKNRKWLIMQ